LNLILNLLKNTRDNPEEISYSRLRFSPEKDHEAMLREFYEFTAFNEYVCQKMACAVLRKSPKTMQCMRSKRNGIAHKIVGGRAFYKKCDVLKLLNQQNNNKESHNEVHE